MKEAGSAAILKLSVKEVPMLILLSPRYTYSRFIRRLSTGASKAKLVLRPVLTRRLFAM